MVDMVMPCTSLTWADYLRASHMSPRLSSKHARDARAAPVARRRDAWRSPGRAGFLGSNLIGSLEEDERIGRIVAIDTVAAPTAGKKTRSYDVDLTQPTAEARVAEILAAERVDAVAHLAFLAEPTHATAWAHELESVGTMHVTVAARQAQVRKLVLWSQTWLYGAHPSNPNFLTEKHPLRAPRSEPFFADKIEAEEQARKLAQRSPGTVVTILRTAPILGPTVRNAFTRYLARKLVPTMMGFDPLVQFLHEVDAIAALHLALLRDVPGTFNVVGEGVLPLSTVIKLAGRIALPVPHPLARTFTRGRLGRAARRGPAVVPQVPALPLRGRRADRPGGPRLHARRTRRARRCSTS